MIGLSFLIFDLEVAFLYPMALFAGVLNIDSFFILFVFLLILFLGFIFELKKGLLQIA